VDTVDNRVFTGHWGVDPVDNVVESLRWGCKLHGEDFWRAEQDLPRKHQVIPILMACFPHILHPVIHKYGVKSP